MAFMQAIQSTIGKKGRKIYETTPQQPKWQGLSIKEKLQAVTGYVRTSDREQRIRRNTVFYLMALYYQGYQNVDLNPGGSAFDVYEREDFYVENQFRRHVDAVVNILSKNEGDIISRPASPSMVDIAKSRAATPILEMQKSSIGYDRVRDIKNLYKVLFGNAFVFVDYIRDKKFGTIAMPKYEYQDIPDPSDPVDGSTITSKVLTGTTEVNRGMEVCAVGSPLEINVRPDIKGFENIPYLQWVSRQDIELMNFLYPGLGLSSGSNTVDADLAQQYLEVLSNLPGNVLGDSLAFNRGASQIKKAEYIRTWLTPVMFAGDKELMREFPSGVHVATVNGEVVDYYEEDLFDHWTHEVLIPVPHSLLGDGLYDAMLLQDQINEMNTLMIQHMRYSTVGHKIYDADIIDPKDIVNDPKNGWIPGRPRIDKNIQGAVQQLLPNSLSPDVPAWITNVKGAMQDVTSVYDPSVGKGLGANTPYSQSVFLSERAQSRWQGSLSYNRPQYIEFHKQLLKIAQNDWTEPKFRAVADRTGSWTWQQFQATDLTGDVELILTNTDMQPRSRAEQIQGLQMLQQIAPLIPSMPPKQKLRVEEILGLPPDTNPMSTQIGRANRHIERLKQGQHITPLPFVDDPMAQMPVFQDFLASEQGEELAETNPQAFSAVFGFMMQLMMYMQQQQGIGAPPPQQGPQAGPPPPAQHKPPGGQPGQNPGGQPAQTPAGPGAPTAPTAPGA